MGYDFVRKAHSDIIHKFIFSAPEMLLPTFSAFGKVMCYLALFCLPALLAVVAMIATARKGAVIPLRLTLVLSVVVLASALITIFFYHQTMPFSENILRVTTIGAQGILGIIRQPFKPRGRMILTIISFLAVVPLTVVLASCAYSLRKKPYLWTAALVTVCMFVCLAFLTLETVVFCTDRYYLIALGPALLAIGFFASRNRIRLVNPISILLLVALASYSVTGNQEYLSANRARWQAIEWLEKTGVKSSVVDGGYEYNVLRDMSVFNSTYRGEAPRDSWRWWPIKGENYIISLSPVPGYKTIHVEPYFSLLDGKTRNIEVLERMVENH
jgi:hypothetical protein